MKRVKMLIFVIAVTFLFVSCSDWQTHSLKEESSNDIVFSKAVEEVSSVSSMPPVDIPSEITAVELWDAVTDEYGWYDYKNKYQAGLTEEICPAPISEKDTDRVQRLAERVSAALMVDVYCRADFLMDNASGEIYCLEANTLPGMTPTSLIPQMGREEGLDFGEVCEKIIKLSMEKYE